MHESNLAELENLFLALSDITRLRLLALMADGEVPVGFLADGLRESQPKTSRHLAYLRNAGLVSARRDGKRIYYNIDRPTDSTVEGILSLTVNSIAAVKGDGKFHFVNQKQSLNDQLFEDSEDIYVETYETEYEQNEMPIYLL